jgi:hypothetical protein
VTYRTNEQFESYFKTVFFPKLSTQDIATLAENYPEDPAEGSPFGTGDNNAVTPQFKRIAALIGDYAFQGPRRFFLQHRSEKQPVWSYRTCASDVIQERF